GSNVSLSSDISNSASLLRETFSGAFDDEDKSRDDDSTYIELLRKKPLPDATKSHFFE
ncbi:11115_t:CDS:1, partial [Acaulospora morrowiae]